MAGVYEKPGSERRGDEEAGEEVQRLKAQLAASWNKQIYNVDCLSPRYYLIYACAQRLWSPGVMRERKGLTPILYTNI